jgi:hypothetical protein
MGKTIVEKLNLQKYKRVVVLNLPEGLDYLADLKDYDTAFSDQSYDLIFAFVLDMKSLKEIVEKVIENHYLNSGGYLYLAYPKKGNKVYETFIHRDDLLKELGTDGEGYVGTSHIKFARMVGLDEVFTVIGLKENVRDKNRTSTKPSQSLDDYIERIPDVEDALKETPDLLAFYQSLTPGYRKDWARYVYSAKQEATRMKRREEMKVILASGYKTRDLYRNR